MARAFPLPLLCASVLAGTLSLPAAGADDKPRVFQKPPGGVTTSTEARFKALDRDGDRMLSREEVRESTTPAERFASADRNGDGKLDLAEFQVLQAEASPDRSYGSVPPGAASTGSGRAGK